ncbi:Uncharacterised protein (plasmid) [Mesomycoplasma conjunctivae]|nr:Uncharacterised protein [Mycoplasmopsis fermentans]VEU67415.1 Uncharacterised protein [Mesomycoplasma conjunctivae]
MFKDLFWWLLFKLYQAPWFILIGLPLFIINSLSKLINFVSFDFLNLMIFGKPLSNINSYEDLKVLPGAFIGIAIFSICLFFIILAISAFKLSYNKSKESFQSFKASLKAIIPNLVFIIVIPILIWVFTFFAKYGINVLNTVISGGQETNELGNLIYQSVAPEPRFIDPFSITFEEFMKDELSLLNSNMGSLFLNSFIAIFALYIVGNITINISINVYQAFFLFIQAPLISVVSIENGGKKLKVWKQQFFSKMLAIMILNLSISFMVLFFSGASKIIKPMSDATGIDSGICALIVYTGALITSLSLNKVMFGIFGVEYTSYLGKFTKKLAAKATKKISKRKSNSKNNSSSEPETTSQTDYHPTGNAKNAELIIIMQNNNQTKKPETTPQTIGAAKKAKKPETLNDWKKELASTQKQMDQLSKTLRGEKDLKKTSEISKELSELIENESSIKRIITSMERKK